MTTDKISRRTLGGLAAAGVGVPLLAACADEPETGSEPTRSPSSASAPSSGDAPTETGGAAPGGEALTTTAAVEVGGGAIFPDQEVVVTQPTAGEFKCFTAVCTHQGCLVSSVSDGTINCDCHGSQYSIENGEVEQGPATFPLDEVPITVSGDSISLA
ncbi:Rieske (2Fe-2S) protein [Nocardioides halotolerans]|uniref:Rieske (2Fe-2S) protein n=1 Tax=Nocardioides halotolerans TaxID=433660 RepID=UPI000418F12D|nr:Rieske (2Fe-2S) protein [Nocardioides halotolerans]